MRSCHFIPHSSYVVRAVTHLCLRCLLLASPARATSPDMAHALTRPAYQTPPHLNARSIHCTALFSLS